MAWASPRLQRALQALEAATGTWDVRLSADGERLVWGVGGRVASGNAAAAQDPAARAAAWLGLHHAVLGIEAQALEFVHGRAGRHAWRGVWQQRAGDLPVADAYVALTLNPAGEVIAVRSDVRPAVTPRGTPPSVDEARRRAVRFLRAEHHARDPLRIRVGSPVRVVDARTPDRQAWAAREVWVGDAKGARWRVRVGGPGPRILEVADLVHTNRVDGRSTGSYLPEYYQDRPVVDVFPWLRIELTPGSPDSVVYSGADGRFGFELPAGGVSLRAPLRGRYATIDNAVPSSPSPQFVAAVTAPGITDIFFGAVQARLDERTLYVHINRMHDLLRSRYGFEALDFPIPALAEAPNPWTGDPNFPNAYWNGEQMGFGNGGGQFYNFAYFADVIYHEYTHAVTDAIYAPVGGLRGLTGLAIHEALADYWAATVLDDPVIGDRMGRNFLTPPLRHLVNRRVWPEDRHAFDEPHSNGEILAGAFWDLRERVGAEIADAVIHHARETFPRTFAEYLDAARVADDLVYGDAYLGNGTPHEQALLEAFGLHGIGPLAARSLTLEHEPLADTEAAGAARTVRVRLHALFPGREDFVQLFYRTGATASWEPVWMQRGVDDAFEGTIPGQPAGTEVQYYVAAARVQPFLYGVVPAGAPQAWLRYRVGPDVTPPDIDVAAPRTWAAFAWPPPLDVTLRDNLGIATAWAEVRIDGGAWTRSGLAPRERGRWRLALPEPGLHPGTVVEYALFATDASARAWSVRWPAAPGTFGTLQVTRTLDLDFEHGASGWRHAPVLPARVDPWHLHAGSGPGGNPGTFWRLAPAAGVPARTAAALVTEAYPLGEGARMQLQSRFDTALGPEGARAGGVVQLRADGDEAWTTLTPIGGYPARIAADVEGNVLRPGTACLAGVSGWTELEFDLAAWAGRRVELRFLFGSSAEPGPPGGLGWDLDDCVIDPGVLQPTDTGTDVPTRPGRVLVRPPWPNPFNPRVTFELQVPEGKGATRLEILDGRGRLLRRLAAGTRSPGRQRLVWDGRDGSGVVVASGVYYYRLRSVLGSETGRIVLVR